MTGILCSLPMIGAPTAETSGGTGFTVSLSRTSVSGSSTSSNITTNSTTASATGGTSPYTYAWERVSGTRSISATSSNSASTSFTRTNCTPGTGYSAVWRCKVTDASGTVVYSEDVSITITCTASGGGSGGGSTGGGTFLGLDDKSVSSQGVAASRTATYSINSDGTCTGGSWNSSSSVGSSYQVKATATSGTPTSGTMGSWLTLSSNRSWSITDSDQDNSAETCSFTLQIRQSGTTTVLDSATITLSANALSTL